MRKEVFENGEAYLGDCLEILPELGSEIAEVAVTSPPYNLKLDPPSQNRRHSKTSAGAERQFSEWYPDDLPEWEYQGQQRTLIHFLLKACKSSIFYNHKIRFAWHSRNQFQSPMKCYHPIQWLNNFPLWCEIIWDRGGINRPTGNRFHIQEERIWQINKPRKFTNTESLSNIWRIPPSKNEGHVCSFPHELVRRCIVTTTDEGDTVIDPYLGSGTTALVAQKYKRRFIGIERDPKYFDLACRRIEEANKQKTLFEEL